jgi:hypothetical protein
MSDNLPIGDHVRIRQHLDSSEYQQVRVENFPGVVGWTKERTVCGGRAVAFTVEFPDGQRVSVPAAHVTVVDSISIPPVPAPWPIGSNVIWPDRWRQPRLRVVGDASQN